MYFVCILTSPQQRAWRYGDTWITYGSHNTSRLVGYVLKYIAIHDQIRVSVRGISDPFWRGIGTMPGGGRKWGGSSVPWVPRPFRPHARCILSPQYACAPALFVVTRLVSTSRVSRASRAPLTRPRRHPSMSNVPSLSDEPMLSTNHAPRLGGRRCCRSSNCHRRRRPSELTVRITCVARWGRGYIELELGLGLGLRLGLGLGWGWVGGWARSSGWG